MEAMEALKSLIIRARSGDIYAFGTIVQRFQDMAVGYAYSILGDFHLAEDAAQEAFIEAYLNLYQLRETEAFPSWFRKVIFKHCDRFTRGKRLETVPLESVIETSSDQKGPAEIAEEKEMKNMVLAAIAELSENQRIATALLLEAGADVNAPFHGSGTAAGTALGPNQEITNLLHSHGAVAGLEAACYWGRTDIVAEMLAVQPSLAQDHIYGAIYQGKTDIVRLMLKRGAKLDPRRFYYWQTALAQTLIHRRLELAELLLEHGEDLNWPSWLGQRPLHLLVARDRADMIEWILDRGADPNLRDWELESTPLGWAARQGNKAIVELLLRRGAKVNLPDDKDKPWATPLARAEKEGHKEIADILRKHGATH